MKPPNPRHVRPFKSLVLALCLLTIPLFHCNGDGPRAIETVTLGSKLYELPSSTFSKKGFFASSVDKIGTVLADPSGLFQVSNNKLSILTLDPITGIAPWRGQFILVASETELMVFTGTLESLNLSDKLQLDKHKLTALTTQTSNTAWIGTDAHLWRVVEDKIDAFSSIKAVTALACYVGSSHIVATTKDNGFVVLRTSSDGSVEQLTLPKDSPSFTTLVPGTGDVLWGLADGKVYAQQKAEDGTSNWVQYILTTDDDQPDTIEHLVLDATTGNIWAVGKAFLFSINNDKILKTKRPDSVKTLASAAATNGTSLWISDGTQLHQFVRQSNQNITYEGQVSVFMKENCTRCHSTLGTASPLDTYDTVKQRIQSIIQQVESGAMPADGKPLVAGDVNTLKGWVENKYAK